MFKVAGTGPQVQHIDQCLSPRPNNINVVWFCYILKEKKMQSKYILRVVEDDIASPYKIVQDIFNYFHKFESVLISLS